MVEYKDQESVKALINKYGGSTKFSRRIDAQLSTVAQWFYNANGMKKWLYDIIAFAMEKGYAAPNYKGEKNPKPKCMYEVNDGSNIFYFGKKLADAKEIINDCLADMPDEKLFLKRNGNLIWDTSGDLEELRKMVR